MRRGLFAPFIAVAGMVQAQTCCLPDFCGSFEVIGEACYLRPSTCDLNYAILDSRDLTGASDQRPAADFAPLSAHPSYASA